MNLPLQFHGTTISDHQVEQFQRLVYRLYQCCQARIQRQAEALDLPDAELRCLRLFGRERYLTPKGIAHQMGVVKSRVTKLIEGLVRKGFIQRFKDPADSRIRLLRLTPPGQAKLDRINAQLKAANIDVLTRIAPDQREALLTHLETLKTVMEASRPDWETGTAGAD
jgi:DNA-binding MarR family transcriptional regulator